MVLVVIGGATGTGKSDAAVRLACALGSRGQSAEVINADAMQLYRGMDIGTAKMSLAERQGVPHHMLDILDVTEEASVAEYQRVTRELIETMHARGTVPILVGGTGLYIDAVIHQLAFPPTDPAVRTRLESEAELVGVGVLAARLREVDPSSARKIGARDARRTIRALEVFEITGTPYSEFTQWANVDWRPHRMLVLEDDPIGREAQLTKRVESMWRAGMLDEVRRLLKLGLEEGKTARRAIGYSQALAQLRGELGEAQAIEQTAQATIKYAKRQRTWFSRYDAAMRVTAGELDVASLADALVAEARPGVD